MNKIFEVDGMCNDCLNHDFKRHSALDAESPPKKTQIGYQGIAGQARNDEAEQGIAGQARNDEAEQGIAGMIPCRCTERNDEQKYNAKQSCSS